VAVTDINYGKQNKPEDKREERPEQATSLATDSAISHHFT
jgi:hypothetical protein